MSFIKSVIRKRCTFTVGFLSPNVLRGSLQETLTVLGHRKEVSPTIPYHIRTFGYYLEMEGYGKESGLETVWVVRVVKERVPEERFI